MAELPKATHLGLGPRSSDFQTTSCPEHCQLHTEDWETEKVGEPGLSY